MHHRRHTAAAALAASAACVLLGSGIANAATAARNRNAALYPASPTMKPAVAANGIEPGSNTAGPTTASTAVECHDAKGTGSR